MRSGPPPTAPRALRSSASPRHGGERNGGVAHPPKLAHKPALLLSYDRLSAAVWAADSKLPEPFEDLAYLRASIVSGCEC